MQEKHTEQLFFWAENPNNFKPKSDFSFPFGKIPGNYSFSKGYQLYLRKGTQQILNL
jgi:hypothetical protein